MLQTGGLWETNNEKVESFITEWEMIFYCYL